MIERRGRYLSRYRLITWSPPCRPPNPPCRPRGVWRGAQGVHGDLLETSSGQRRRRRLQLHNRAERHQPRGLDHRHLRQHQDLLQGEQNPIQTPVHQTTPDSCPPDSCPPNPSLTPVHQTPVHQTPVHQTPVHQTTPDSCPPDSCPPDSCLPDSCLPNPSLTPVA